MDNRNSNNGSRNEQNRKDHQPIDYWEDIRAVLERERDVGRKHLSFTIDMQRPVFMDGTMGYYRLNTFIKIDRNYLQLSTSALSALANYFYYNRERIVSAIEEVRNRNGKIDQMSDEQSGTNDRFEGLENETEEDCPESEEESDYEEVSVINPSEVPDETESINPTPTPNATPRRIRRNTK